MPIAIILFNSHNIKDKSTDYATVTANRMVSSSTHAVGTSGQWIRNWYTSRTREDVGGCGRETGRQGMKGN